eukprot:1156201-Pelagomonas_calceolata.AAC.9
MHGLIEPRHPNLGRLKPLMNKALKTPCTTCLPRLSLQCICNAAERKQGRPTHVPHMSNTAELKHKRDAGIK